MSNPFKMKVIIKDEQGVLHTRVKHYESIQAARDALDAGLQIISGTNGYKVHRYTGEILSYFNPKGHKVLCTLVFDKELEGDDDGPAEPILFPQDGGQQD